MCDPFTLAALGTAVFGTGASIAGQASTKKQNAADLQGQTQASAAEFDKRNSMANDIFAKNAVISKDTYTEMANLSDQEFTTRTGLSKDAFNALSRIQQDQVARDFTSAQTNVDTGRDARLGRDATVDQALAGRDATQAAARAKYDAAVTDANAKQDQFRGRGDAVSGDLLAAFTPEAMAQRRTAATAQRDALVAGTTTPTRSTASATAADNVRAAFDRYSKAGTDKAATESRAGSALAGYSDAVATGDRTINQGNERTAFIKDAAARALSPLGATLDANSLGFNNAADTAAGRTGAAKARYGDRTNAADADLGAALGLSATRAAGETKPVVDYTSAMDNAQAAFYGGRQNSAGTHGDTLIGANNTQLQGSNSASSNLENNMANITQFKMANNSSPWTSLGQFASTIAPTLMNIGQQKAFAKQAAAPAGSA